MKAKTARRNDSKADVWTYPTTHKAIEIALYYGFSFNEPLTIEKSDRDCAKSVVSDEKDLFATEEKVALLRTHFSEDLPPLPLMLIQERASSSERKKDSKHTEYTVDIIGSTRSVADATVIKTAFESAQAEGYTNLTLEINSIGDKDSLNRYTKEITTYFKKNSNELDPECRQLLKNSAFDILTCDHEKCQPIKERMPQPMNYLSEPSRVHFMEVLEFVETLEIPYTITGTLIQNSDIASHTLFKLFGTAPEKTSSELVAYGYRWAGLAKKMGFKKDIQAVSAVLCLPKVPKQEIKLKKLHKPYCYFIQMGQEAKLKSLILIELLREAKIPIYHSLTKDKLTAQLTSAEALNVPFILIMGQKESMDNTVLIREMRNRSQDTVRLTQVADYLKKHFNHD